MPEDNGACAHLSDRPKIPSVPLISTRGDDSQGISLSAAQGLTILFCYPRMAAPDEQIPDDWNNIPGARGCTPQACSFRDKLPRLQKMGVSNVYGLSTQTPEEQKEAHSRLHLQYDLLSDENLKFVSALNLPTFEWKGKRVVKRITLAIGEGKVIHHWYPVFPSDRNVDNVLQWLEEKQT